jgi:very-short-patch-repair endonuclease
MLHGPPSTQCKARQLRRSLTLPEVKLWQALRQRPGGLRFRRQHPAGPYILDFYCPAHRLAVEIDGDSHNNAAQWQHDQARDAWFATHGVLTLRIPARDVLADCDAVITRILATATTREP